MTKTQLFFSLFLFILIFFQLFPKIENHPFHEDEETYLRQTKFFGLFFIKKDFKSPDWQEFLSLEQPPLAKYLFGFVNYLAFGKNYYPESSVFQEAGWHNYTHQVLPSSFKINVWLKTPRLASSFLSFCTCLILFFTIKTIAGFSAGFIATILLVKNQLFYLASRWAIPDASLLFFLILAFSLTLQFQEKLAKKNFKACLIYAALIGMASGLAAGFKENGSMAILFFLLYLFFCFLKLKIAKAVLFLSALLSISFSLFFFIFLNPPSYKQPLFYLRQMVKLQKQIAVSQQKQYPESALLNPSQRLKAVFSQILSPKAPFANFSLFSPLHLDLLFFLTGFINLVRLKSNKNTLLRLWFFQGFFVFCCLIFYLPLSWDRYFLPLLPFLVSSEAIGLNFFLKKLF